MPHDKNGQLLKVGDKVNLAGIVTSIDSEQPTFCNIQFRASIGMEPSQDGKENAPGFCLSARMVERVDGEQPNPILLDKELRRDIDAIIQRLKLGAGELNTPPIPGECQRQSEWRTEARGNLQYAVMSLGMDLKAINDENPQPAPPVVSHVDALETAWGLIANAGGGDWTKESTEWQEAAARWRDQDYGPAVHPAASTANPYPNSKDPSNTVIDKTADGLKL